MNVLICPDKFKGTLTAHQAAAAISTGWRTSRPNDRLEQLPMSDGGDGFGEIIGESIGATPVTSRTIDAAHRSIDATWWWAESTCTALIESAGIIGLAQLPRGQFHPFELDTFGLGTVIADARKRGASKIIIGIGGSATNDAGFGMARALGWTFLNPDDQAITSWTDLAGLKSIRSPSQAPGDIQTVVASDVGNPLLGPEGCSRVYGPQKGLLADDFEAAERNLAALAQVAAACSDRDLSTEPGAGAAGGLGFGLQFFLNGQLQPGFNIFADQVSLDEKLAKADLVITGEGAIDQSTAMGKGVGQLASVCAKHGVPCIALAGAASLKKEDQHLFGQIHAMTSGLTTEENAMKEPSKWLAKLAAAAALNLST